MSGHSRWDSIRPATEVERTHLHSQALGYAMAMEDLLNTIEDLESKSFEDRDSVYYQALDSVKATVVKSLKSCESTLEELRGMR